MAPMYTQVREEARELAIKFGELAEAENEVEGNLSYTR